MSTRSGSQNPSLHGAEGELVSVRISVAPRLLERLLDVLAGVSFPINPQLYHDAAIVRIAADGCRRPEPVSVVEFPAWTGRLREIEEAVVAGGFDAAGLSATDILAAGHAPDIRLRAIA